jgi:hypothetical protein
MKKLSTSQLWALRNIANGKAPGDGISGRSAHGGLTATMHSLYVRGLICDGKLTEQGWAVLRRSE